MTRPDPEPVQLQFLFGVGEIAAFLRLPEAKVERMIEAGELPVKKDGLGRLVLNTFDFRGKYE